MNNFTETLTIWLRRGLRTAQDWVAVQRLRWQIAVEKVRNYDRLVADLQGLMQALHTKDRQIDDLHQKLAAANEEFRSLQQELTRLQEHEHDQRAELIDTERRALFRRLESTLVQLPAMRQTTNDGADIAAEQILDVVAPLEEAMLALGFEPIGLAGVTLSYDPRHHKVVGKGARSIRENDLVRVRYVGYRYKDEILSKAEVAAVLEQEPAT